MKEISAVGLRASLAKVAKALANDGEPILLKIGHTPAGVIVSLKDYREKFALKVAEEERRNLVNEIKETRIKVKRGVVEKALDGVRRK